MKNDCCNLLKSTVAIKMQTLHLQINNGSQTIGMLKEKLFSKVKLIWQHLHRFKIGQCSVLNIADRDHFTLMSIPSLKGALNWASRTSVQLVSPLLLLLLLSLLCWVLLFSTTIKPELRPQTFPSNYANILKRGYVALQGIWKIWGWGHLVVPMSRRNGSTASC